MNIKNDVARLERAGSEHSRWLEKLQQAVDRLALFLKEQMPDANSCAGWLPRDHSFQHWPSGDYKLTHPKEGIYLTAREKPRAHLLWFAKDVAEGWLDEVSTHLEEKTAQYKTGALKIEQFLEKGADRKS